MRARKRRSRKTSLETLHPARSVDELTQHNVELIAEMRRAADRDRTFGERVADLMADIIGSWTFIVVQSVVLGIWMTLNVVAWLEHWDPYPFILLNLVLSFQAAYAGPIILMSQNRQGRLTERRNHLDLQINLLAEQETTEILRLLRKLCDQHGIEIENALSVQALEQATCPEKVVRQIEKSMEPTPRDVNGNPPRAEA